MSNANIDELNGQAVLDLIMGRLGRKDSAVEHWKGPSERIDNQMA